MRMKSIRKICIVVEFNNLSLTQQMLNPKNQKKYYKDAILQKNLR